VNEKQRQLHDLAREVATGMGLEWNYDADRSYDHLVVVTGPEGSGVHIVWEKRGSNGGSRLYVGGHWPEPEHVDGNHMSFHPDRRRHGDISITVSASREPRVIAKDILRRFVPGYLRLYAEQVVLKTKYLERDAKETAHCQTERGRRVGAVAPRCELALQGPVLDAR
jgi:hypothetical protein